MNYASLIFGAVLIFALVFYAVKQRHIYTGPVVQVRNEEDLEHSETGLGQRPIKEQAYTY